MSQRGRGTRGRSKAPQPLDRSSSSQSSQDQSSGSSQQRLPHAQATSGQMRRPGPPLQPTTVNFVLYPS